MSLRNHQTQWDVAVIGAGPAGCSAAREAARAGFRTLILERKKEVGIPVQCAEYVPLAVALEGPKESWAQTVEGMLTFVGGELIAENRWPGVVLHRGIFDRAMARQAVEAGAQLLTGCVVERIQGTVITFRQAGRVRQSSTAVIVGADGPLSLAARSVGLLKRDFLYALQVRAKLSRPINRTQVHFWPDLTGGYGWVFPKEEFANVGVGVRKCKAHRLSSLLHGFLLELGRAGVIRERSWSGLSGGLVPAGGPPLRTVVDNLLLVGDAAGQTDPITGGGIPNAMLCGRLAGQIAAEALDRGAIKSLNRYEEVWREMIWPSLNRAMGHRRAMEEGWARRPFQDLIRRHWIAFPNYYRGTGIERA